MTHIPILVRFLRATRNLTQESLSEQVGIDYRHYQRIEAGQVSIRLETIDRIARAFNLSLREFFKIHDYIGIVSSRKHHETQTAKTLLNLFLGAGAYKLPDQLYHSVTDLDALLKSGKINDQEDSETPLIQMRPSGDVIWWNQSARKLFSGDCIKHQRIPILSQSCKECELNCLRVLGYEPSYDRVFQQMVVSKGSSHLFYFWGHVSDKETLSLTCLPQSQ